VHEIRHGFADVVLDTAIGKMVLVAGVRVE
jgi:hypothetical protein